jgi:alcohol dehydrogenase
MILNERIQLVAKYPKIIFGNNSIEVLPNEVFQIKKENPYSMEKILIISDSKLRSIGILDKVEKMIKKTDVPYEVFDKIAREPKIDDVIEVLNFIGRDKYDLVIGIGGGSSLDVAKIVSVMITNTGTIEEYLRGKELEKSGLYKILIPTTSGSGSEISYAAAIFYEGFKRILRSPYLISDVAIIDPLLTISMPPSVTASSGLDAFSHAIESYVSKYSNPLSDSLSIKAMELIFKNLPIAYKYGDDIIARSNMSLASLMAIMAATSGAGGVCLPHAISHCLPEKCKLPHGILCAVTLPSFLKRALSFIPKYKLLEIARIFEISNYDNVILAIVNAIEDLNEKLKVPKIILGFKNEDIPYVIEKVFKYFKRQLLRTPFDVQPNELKNLLKELISD